MTEEQFKQQLEEVVSNIGNTVNHLETRVKEAIELIKRYEDIIVENDPVVLTTVRREILEKRGDQTPAHMRPIMDLGKLFSQEN